MTAVKVNLKKANVKGSIWFNPALNIGNEIADSSC